MNNRAFSMIKSQSGEDQAWAKLITLDPAKVCPRTTAHFDDRTATYTLRSCGCEISISTNEKKISSDSPNGSLLLDKLDPAVTLLWYLAFARFHPPSGKLINPGSLPGGQIFNQGAHVLPLAELAAN